MAKLKLSSKVKLVIEDNGTVFKTFNVTFKEPTKKELKEIGEDNKEILELVESLRKLEDKKELLNRKADAQKSLKQFKKEIETLEEISNINKSLIGLDERFEKLGGADTFNQATVKAFNVQVGGEDREALREFCENNLDFETVINALREDVKEQKGK